MQDSRSATRRRKARGARKDTWPFPEAERSAQTRCNAQRRKHRRHAHLTGAVNDRRLQRFLVVNVALDLVSDVCMAAHSTVATWLMHTSSGTSSLLLSLLTTAASLPFFFSRFRQALSPI